MQIKKYYKLDNQLNISEKNLIRVQNELIQILIIY